jgi:predicted ATP-grasp superfamily ATP-dependent carboligase
MWDGNTVFAGAFIRDRWADSGSSSHGYFTENVPQCADTSKICEFLERINYHGLFSVEYGLYNDKAYFFEINLRNDGTSHYFFQAGANIPLAYVYSSAGLDYSHIPTKVNDEKWFIDEIFDVENVILRKITKKTWKKDMEEATVFKYYDEEDVIPYKMVKKGRLKQIIQDIILKRFRLYIVFVLDKVGLRK